MSAPSVTYTFTNSTVADATQVNQNFTDLINGVSDGTKDLTVLTLTSSVAVFTSNFTIGASSLVAGAPLAYNASTGAMAFTPTTLNFGMNPTVTYARSGNTVGITVSNSSNTASSDARLSLAVAGTSANDAFVRYDVTGTTVWAHGIDNSVAGDPWVLSANGILGTNNALSITTAGVISATAISLTSSLSASGFVSANNSTTSTGSGNGSLLCSGGFGLIGPMNTASYIRSELTANNNYIMASVGANDGFISNVTTGIWALGYGPTAGTLGTSVITWSSAGLTTIAAGTATAAGGAAAIKFGSSGVTGVYFGSGAPTITAPQGALYLRTDGSSTSTRAYVNTTGSTTWTAITTVA